MLAVNYRTVYFAPRRRHCGEDEEGRGEGSSVGNKDADRKADGGKGYDWLTGAMMFTDGFEVGDFRFMAGSWYASAGNCNDPSGYHQVEQDSITMKRSARKILEFRITIIGNKERVRGAPAYCHVGSCSKDNNEMDRSNLQRVS
eukprot:GFKZ01010711.1.p1 GENE.GFKZ01010711.1~~GFKZ01010711.1.p1  ORF type:complete len:144 (+),score=11.52 GFKZ01010711.1:123-554(+)